MLLACLLPVLCRLATQIRTVLEMSSARTVQGVPSTYRPPRGTVPQHGPGAAGTPPPRDPDLAFLAIARQAVTSSGFTKRDTLVGHAPGNCAHPGWRDRIIWKLGGLASPRLVSGRYSNVGTGRFLVLPSTPIHAWTVLRTPYSLLVLVRYEPRGVCVCACVAQPPSRATR